MIMSLLEERVRWNQGILKGKNSLYIVGKCITSNKKMTNKTAYDNINAKSVESQAASLLSLHCLFV